MRRAATELLDNPAGAEFDLASAGFTRRSIQQIRERFFSYLARPPISRPKDGAFFRG